jgi:hypothetical protein
MNVYALPTRRTRRPFGIKPVRKRGLVALLKTMKPLAEDFSDIDE